MLHGIPLNVTVGCAHCHQPVHVQGFVERERCEACTGRLELPLDQWASWFSLDEVLGALELPEGEGRQTSVLGAVGATYAYGHRMPRCQGCQADVPADRLDDLARAGGYTCGCGEPIRVREAPAALSEVFPGARWLVNEGPADGDEPRSAAEPVQFACMGCGGALVIDGSERTVRCRYCESSNYLPDGLWRRLHPPRTVRTFFVVLETSPDGSVAPELLERLAASEDWEVRQRAAANPGLPPSTMERLCEDDDRDVREALAANPALPAHLLARLARDDDSDIRASVARNPETPIDALRTLLRDDDYRVRVAAVEVGRLTDADLAGIAAEEYDSDVLDALGRARLGARALAALAANTDSYRARVVAARHPAAPPELLNALAADDDSDVREALLEHPALPPATVLRLAASDDDALAERAKRLPAWAEAAAKRRRRRVMVAGALASALLCLGALTGLVGAATVAVRWATQALP